MTNPKEPAFPVEFPGDTSMKGRNGLTKREHFAALICAALSANPDRDATYEVDAIAAVSQADALIAELNKEPK